MKTIQLFTCVLRRSSYHFSPGFLTFKWSPTFYCIRLSNVLSILPNTTTHHKYITMKARALPEKTLNSPYSIAIVYTTSINILHFKYQMLLTPLLLTCFSGSGRSGICQVPVPEYYIYLKIENSNCSSNRSLALELKCSSNSLPSSAISAAVRCLFPCQQDTSYLSLLR